jgi:hypothetical protein
MRDRCRAGPARRRGLLGCWLVLLPAHGPLSLARPAAANPAGLQTDLQCSIHGHVLTGARHVKGAVGGGAAPALLLSPSGLVSTPLSPCPFQRARARTAEWPSLSPLSGRCRRRTRAAGAATRPTHGAGWELVVGAMTSAMAGC